MKKIFFAFILLSFTICYAQKVKLAFVSNPSIDKNKNTSLLDSLIKKLNIIEDLDFVIITGNLTSSGAEKEFLMLKSSLNNLTKPYYLLPNLRDLSDANGWLYYNDLFEDKFAFKNNEKFFVGLSSSLPFTNFNHYTLENLDWLNEALDTIKQNEEIYLFTAEQFENSANNWKIYLNQFSNPFGNSKKNLKLIINGNCKKTALRNLLGYTVLDVSPSFQYDKKLFDFILIEISNDSVKIFNNTNKIITAFDKSIEIQKEKIEIADIQSFNSDILMKTSLNATMLTSCNYWNEKIYASDQSGLISCIDSTGNVLWEYDANGNIYGKPAIADRMIAVATFQGDLITLSAVSGEQIQSIGFDDYITTNLLIIDYKGERELMIPKLTQSNSAIVFGTASGKIFCYDLETLQEYWVNDYCKEMITSKLFYIDNKIFYTSKDGFLYCIDSRTGVTIWRWKEKANSDLSYSNIISDGKRIFVVSQDGILYAVNLLLGKLDWKIENYNFLLSIGLSKNKKYVYAESKNNKFLIINTDKGKIEKEIKVDETFFLSFSYPIESEKGIIWGNNGFVSYFDAKYNPVKSLFLGYAPLHPIEKISENKYLVSNIDGTIIIFQMR